MPIRHVARHIASWVATLAILMAALAPAISQALDLQGRVGWIEVCTTQGAKWVKADANAGTESEPGAEHEAGHCPYCTLHPNLVGLPPAPLQALPAPASGRAVPAAFLSAPRTLHAWVSAQPRAPPCSS